MIGRILGNRYEIVEKIGGGGMALVYKAKCNLLNRYVAIKILRTEFTNDDEFINKFRRESQSAASLSHPNIVNIYDVGVEDDIYYIVMEYIKGKTLKELIQEKGRLNIEETLDYAIQIAEALNHAHVNHIVHRDIKPHNILVTEDSRMKVTDFGIARAATASTVTNTSNVIGSVHYFSPEQARGGYTDEKSDIYSLGVVMYEMVTGRVPFQGESPISVAIKHIQEDILPPSEINNSIPKNIENIIMKCVQKDQSLRYSSTSQLLNDLRKVQSSPESGFIDFTNYNESPTMIIPAVNDEIINNNRKLGQERKVHDEEDGSKKRKSNRTVTIIAILAAFLLTIGLAFGFFLIKDYFTGEEIQVPSVVGERLEDARETIVSLGLDFRVKNEIYSEEYKAGYVISQEVGPGDIVKKGYPISVTISKGNKMVKVPNLVNKYVNEIEILLDAEGLKVGEPEYEFSDIPSGIVISQSPEADSEVAEGTIVNIKVSKGPEIEYVIVPTLTGINIEEAKNEIIARNLTYDQIKYEDNDDILKNIVIWQSYSPGTEVEENTSIDLIVSNGPPQTENNGDNSENDGSEGNNDTGSEELVEKQLVIKLPQDKDETEVRVKKIQGNIEELVYNKIHKASEESISVTVSGKGNMKFEIYFDGEFKATKDITF